MGIQGSIICISDTFSFKNVAIVTEFPDYFHTWNHASVQSLLLDKEKLYLVDLLLPFQIKETFSSEC